jgi:TRAP-type C4-dicarboxylate transport system permease small subunit
MRRLFLAFAHWADRVLLVVLTITLFALVIVSFAGVIARLMYSPLVWADELMRYLFVWMTMIGVIIVASRRAHIVIDALDQMLPEKARKWVLAVSELIVMAFCILLLKYSFNFVEMGMKQISSALRWPMVWVYISFPIAFAGQILMSLKQIVLLWDKSAAEVNTNG